LIVDQDLWVGGIYFICHTFCDKNPRFFRFHLKDRPNQSPLTTRKGMQRTYSNLDSHRSQFSRLLWHARGHCGPILSRMLTGRCERGMHWLIIARIYKKWKGCTFWCCWFEKRWNIFSSLVNAKFIPMLLRK
jgi:hypothetical protein